MAQGENQHGAVYIGHRGPDKIIAPFFYIDNDITVRIIIEGHIIADSGF